MAEKAPIAQGVERGYLEVVRIDLLDARLAGVQVATPPPEKATELVARVELIEVLAGGLGRNILAPHLVKGKPH